MGKNIIGHGPSLLGKSEAFESTKVNKNKDIFPFFIDTRFISKVYLGFILALSGASAGHCYKE